MSGTRLDRLVTLLETGSTALIRNTAADQLADVQKQHPEDLYNLLSRVLPYLRSSKWDTRVAAARALGGIVSNAEKYDPNAEDEPVKSEHQAETNGHSKAESSNGNGSSVQTEAHGNGVDSPTEDQLELDHLELSSVLRFGKHLLGSASKEYNHKLQSMDPPERLAYLKKSLKGRLGLAGKYFDEDLLAETDMPAQTPGLKTPAITRIDTSISRSDSIASATVASPGPTPGGETKELSKRQQNALKRKQKKQGQGPNKVQIVDLGPRRQSSAVNPQTPAAAPEPHAIKLEPKDETENGDGNDYFSLERQGGDDTSTFVKEFKGAPIPEKSVFQADVEEEGLEWPFERVCEYLSLDLFDYAWEIRHGAAMGLREVIRVHGGGGGRVKGKTRAQNDKLNQRWLNDLACRLCCVFMLDRFADYTSDTAVAPIRETAGQTLGSVLQHLSRENVIATFKVLHRLVMQQDDLVLDEDKSIWQICQGGMIGMRYLVAVRNDLLLEDSELMDGVLSAVIKGLGDFDDDVRAISAATLIPVAKEFVEMRPNALEHLMDQVWSCLSSLQDDLSASTGSIMDLLAKLCGFPQVLSAMQANAKKDPSQSFHELVPRLFPFLRHTITSVRAAVLRALITFLGIQGSGSDSWIDSKALQLIFQNILLERNEQVLKLSLQLWNAVIDDLAKDSTELATHLAPTLDSLIPLTLTPIGITQHPIPMDQSLLIRPSGQTMGPAPAPRGRSTPPGPGGESANKRRKKSKLNTEEATPTQSTASHNLDGPMITGDTGLVGEATMIRSRASAACALGKAMAAWPEDSREQTFALQLLPHLQSTKSTTQLTAAMVMEEYGRNLDAIDALATRFTSALLPIAEGARPSAYEDTVPKLQVVRTHCTALLSIFHQGGVQNLPQIAVVVQGDPSASQYAFSIADAEKILNHHYEKLKRAMSPDKRMIELPHLENAKAEVEKALRPAIELKEVRDIRIKAAAAGAMVALKSPPKKPGQTIKAMMDSVKTEENYDLQKRSAAAVAGFIVHLVGVNKAGVVNKIVGNLVKFYCMETAETPEFPGQSTIETGILTLKKDEDIRDHPDAAKWAEESKAARITKRGAREALEQVVENFGDEVFDKVPVLKEVIEKPIKEAFTPDELPSAIRDETGTFGQSVVDGLSTLRALVGKFHPDVRSFVRDLLPLVAKALQSRLYVLRYIAAKCFATLCSVMPVEAFTMLVETVLPTIGNNNVHWRQGAIECIYHLIHVMEDGILPYVIFLITPVLGRMSDSDNDVRLLATTSFATLVKLVPLEAGIPDPPGLPESLLKGREKERKFVAQMLDAKKVEPFEIPVGIKATLRSYQQDGVNWLAFLNRYNLHGILCDDMGLGKTLQTLCMVASDHFLRAQEFEKSQDPNCRRIPSLIVCPPTLSGHWQQEIRQYAPFLSCVAYVGSPTVRGQVREQLEHVDIVITSYDICRNDNEILKPLSWNYCVLDEGHLIKNSKSKTSQAVKNFNSNHRLILSGTPIQNNVLELWSLFDFLMPGFLGSEKVFQERFAKPIAASRFAKSSSKEQEKGALAIEALHKQVLPFLLRRLKEEVLDDLPPKILQNYYCDLSDLQRKLFEEFTKKEGKEIQAKAGNADRDSKQHIFQALQYMKKLCNSPALVMKPTHKAYEQTQKLLKGQGSSLEDIAHAPKLGALKDLLVDCGIGAADVEKDKSGPATGDLPEAVSQHRALVFCQMKEMLDMVQSQVLQKLLPSVQFMRLDGSVEASKRQDIVNKFNSDPSYDVLLLTTSVGGLGLNLTGADTVIFVEHDWNPQKDIQAMDRAHRIGQKKVVNVYRIVTRGTLEEKILNLQRFKIDVASTVVNQQNAGLGSMQTDQILDLFNVSADSADPAALPPPPDNSKGGSSGMGIDENDAVDAEGRVREKGQKGFLDEIGELWDEDQYNEEFDLEGFLGKMKG